MKLTIVLSLALLIGALLIAGCDKPQQPPQQPPQQEVDAADAIYTGGDIVTVSD